VWFEVSEMLKDEDTGLLLFGKLDNAMADLMGTILIQCAYLCPQGHIVLFASGNDACLASVSCYPSQLSRAFDRAVAFPLQ